LRRSAYFDLHGSSRRECGAFDSWHTQVDMRLDQLQTMLEPYPFLQVTRYGVYRDSLCMDELANMVSDSSLASVRLRTHGKASRQDDDFLSLLRLKATKMGCRSIRDPMVKP
jgi:hypothetical protein